MKMKIGIVDDHKMIRNGLKMMLELINVDVTLEAENGLDMIEKLTEMKKTELSEVPDFIFLDISMPKIDGFEAAKWLKSNFPTIKIIILTMKKEIESIEKMIKIGVDSYLTKDVGLSEIQESLNIVSIGEKYFSNSITNILVNSFLEEKKLTDEEAKIKLLTEKEINYIKLLAKELSNAEMAKIMCISPRTVDSYKDSIMNKLNVKTRIGIVVFALKNGIL